MGKPPVRNITAADKAAAERLRKLWEAMPASTRPRQAALADRFPSEHANQSLISQYLTGKIALNYRAVRFFAKELGVPESAIRTDLPEQVLNPSPPSAERRNYSRDESHPAGIAEPILHEALTLLLFDLDHGGPRSTSSAFDLFLKLCRRIEACGGRLPDAEQEAFEAQARARGKKQGEQHGDPKARPGAGKGNR